ncbi:MAG: hypothetical protein HKN17_00950 [Rhodothermales bacterium]|nr:hypothetical protein [Rhodothermales bacterium]
MELVPILSTIILVGTIATFILAVAAYILYKIRERRSGREPSAQETRREEPHVLVEPARRGALEPRRYPDVRERYAARPHRQADPESYANRATPGPYRPGPEQIHPRSDGERLTGGHESLFWEYTDEGFVPVRTEAERATRDEDRSADSDRAAWA